MSDLLTHPQSRTLCLGPFGVSNGAQLRRVIARRRGCHRENRRRRHLGSSGAWKTDLTRRILTYGRD